MRAAFHLVVLEGHVDAGGTVLVSWLVNAGYSQLQREPILSVRLIGGRQTSVYLPISILTAIQSLK